MSRTVIPHFLRRQRKASASFETKNENAIRIGRITAVLYPDDPKNSNKKVTEYEVLVYYSTDKDRTTILYHHVKVSSLFGGAADHLRWTPRISSDKTEGKEATKGKKKINEAINLGSLVLIACIDGDMRSGLIIGGWPHPNDTPDTDKDDGHNLKFQFNGLDIKINKDGELTVERLGPTKVDGAPVTDNDDAAGAKVFMDKEGTIKISTPKDKQTIVVNHKDNTTTITSEHVIIDSENIELGGKDLQKAIALAPETKDEIKALRDWAAGHTHMSNDKFSPPGTVVTVPTGAPLSGPPPVKDVGAQRVKGK